MKKVKFVCYIQKRRGEISEIDKNDKTHPEGWVERRIIMFWNNLVTLCNKNNTSPTAVANVLGIAIGSITKWKNGSVPRDTTLKKIADYFGVSPESLVSAPTGPVYVKQQSEDREQKLLALYDKIEDKEGLIRFIERLSALSAEQQKFVFDNLLQGQ